MSDSGGMATPVMRRAVQRMSDMRTERRVWQAPAKDLSVRYEGGQQAAVRAHMNA